MSRLFYPTLFMVTAVLAALLWTRHGLPIQWLASLGTAVAQAQVPGAPGAKNRPLGAQRLPATSSAASSASAVSRPRQAPLTQLQIETPGGPGAMEVTRPVQVTSAKVVARVGDEVILAADLLPMVNEQFQQLIRVHPNEDPNKVAMTLMYHAVQDGVRAKLIVADMKKEIPKEKVGEVKKDILKTFQQYKLPELLKQLKASNEAELDLKLKAKGTSLEAMKGNFVDQVLVQEWLRKAVNYDDYVSHDELLNHYNEHIQKYQFKAKVRYEEIRVNYGRRRDRRAAWNTIHQLARQVFDGAPFSQIAKERSDALSAAQGGVCDWTNEGSIACKELDRALFRLPLGVLSEIIDDVKTKDYVVVRVRERKPAGTTTFQEVQAGIRKEIKGQREKKAREKKIDDFMLKNKHRVWTIYDEVELNATKPGDKPMGKKLR